jgi:hypothetical protein
MVRRREEMIPMAKPELERCPDHPDRDPVWRQIGEVRSANAGYPVRTLGEWRCPVDGCSTA